eukprot:754632-Prymnesium_polylepis.1
MGRPMGPDRPHWHWPGAHNGLPCVHIHTDVSMCSCNAVQAQLINMEAVMYMAISSASISDGKSLNSGMLGRMSSELTPTQRSQAAGMLIYSQGDQFKPDMFKRCLLYTSPSPRDAHES